MEDITNLYGIALPVPTLISLEKILNLETYTLELMMQIFID